MPQALRPCGLPSKGFRDLITVFGLDGTLYLLYLYFAKGHFINAHSYHTKAPPQGIEPYIAHYTNPGDLVLDPFYGSGMTGVAAHAGCVRRMSTFGRTHHFQTKLPCHHVFWKVVNGWHDPEAPGVNPKHGC